MIEGEPTPPPAPPPISIGKLRMKAAHEALAKKRAAVALKRLIEEKTRIDELLARPTVSGEGEKVIEEIIPPKPIVIPSPLIIPEKRGEELKDFIDDPNSSEEEGKKMSESEEIEAVPIENKPVKKSKRKTPPQTRNNSSEDEETKDKSRRKDTTTHKRPKKKQRIESVPIPSKPVAVEQSPPNEPPETVHPINAAMVGITEGFNRVRAIELPPVVSNIVRDSAATCGWAVVVFSMVLLRGFLEKKYGLRTGTQYIQQQTPVHPQQQWAKPPNSSNHHNTRDYPMPTQTRPSQGGSLLSR